MIITHKAHSRSRISCVLFYQVVIVRLAVSYSEGTVFETLSRRGAILTAFLCAYLSLCDLLLRYCMKTDQGLCIISCLVKFL